MSFQQITINIESKYANELCDIFMTLNAISTITEDQYAGTELEQPIFGEPNMPLDQLWDHSKLTILFADDINIEEVILNVSKLFNKHFDYKVDKLDDQDWVRMSQEQFTPIKINDKLSITPSWHNVSQNNYNKINIILDPGLAFGTGSHATTFMCLDWISKNVNANTLNVIDYGCGSGILAIAAKKFGAQNVIATDIDNQALEACDFNCHQNNVDIQIIPSNNMLNLKSNIVIANILSNPLKMLAPLLANLTTDILLLSGILINQIEELSNLYSQWFEINVANKIDGWVLLECHKVHEKI